MTVNNASSKITYLGNGSTTSFSFNFSTPDTQSIRVITVDSAGIATIQSPGAYSIVLNPLVGANPTPTGGTVNYPLSGPPLPNGNSLIIVRDLAVVQPVSLANQGTLYPIVIEKELDYLTMLDQEGTENSSRAFTANIVDPVPHQTVPVAQRANHFVYFDANGDLVPGATPVGTVIISAAMVPVVTAPTLAEAREAMGIRTTKTVSTTYGISSADNGTIFNLIGGAFYSVSLGVASGFPGDFINIIMNNDTRGKLISIDSFPSFILWPTQSLIISKNGAGDAWVFTRSGRWRSTVSVVFNVDYVNGSDSGDGLGTLGQAFKTIQYAVNILENECDGPFRIQLANGTHQVGTGVTCSKPLLGSAGYSITGNNATPANCKVIATSGTCLAVTNNASLKISGMEFSSGSGNCLVIANGAIMDMSLCRFGNAPGGYHIDVTANAILNITGPYTVLSGATCVIHLVCNISALCTFAPGNVTFEGSCSLGFFWYVQFSSTLWAQPYSITNPGVVGGTQYNVAFNSVCISAGSTVPGTNAGVVSLGGIFQ
jgi:hypothetical protein